MKKTTIQTETGVIIKPHPDHKEKTYTYKSHVYDVALLRHYDWIERANLIGNHEYEITISYHTEDELTERVEKVETIFETKLKLKTK